MAPGIMLTQADTTPSSPVKRSLFPDGLKTSGQHAPVYSQIRPYEDFPKEISGPTLWKAQDFKFYAERWTHRFRSEDIAELSAAADEFMASGTPLTGISKV